MKKYNCALVVFLFVFVSGYSQDNIESDIIKTSKGDLEMFFVNHGTLMFKFNDLVIHVDPVGRGTDYTKMPKADIILVTHQHGDHLDKNAINLLSTSDTKLILTQTCHDEINMGEVMRNGDVKTVDGIKIEAVPAYNVIHKRDNGEPFHPKGIGNGYVINFGDKRVYVAGDTENFPEMKDLKDIDVAFLPMNLPYTMTPEMVVKAVNMFHPKIMYPYHYGQTDLQKLEELLANQNQTELRLRNFYK
jgi:L-ascorbate metabolism protein UlaG (beta-lactamase superfamily)